MKNSTLLQRLSIATLTLISSAHANEASPFPFPVTQPDGTEVMLRLRGDQHYHWLQTTSGYTVVRDDAQRFVFAELDETGDLKASQWAVGKASPAELGLSRELLPSAEILRSKGILMEVETNEGLTRSLNATRSLIAASGTIPSVVILMRFADHTGRTLPSASDFDTIFNAVGGDATLAPTGSVRDYYLETSYGSLTLDSTVLAWVTLPETEAFYANGVSAAGSGTRIRQAIREALELADPLVDFSGFDTNADSFIDSIAFVHSGYGAEWGGVDSSGASYTDRIWSHRWNIPTWTSDEGVRVSDYHVNPGLWSTSGRAPGRIGVICHESGHFFGLPDLYHTGSGPGSGIGSWGLMANSWGFDGTQLFPPHMSAWSKVQLGWVTPIDVSTAGTYSVAQAETPGADIYKVSDGYPAGEYLLIENRQAVGFDQGIPSGVGGQGGLAVWHIDESVPANNNPGCPGDSDWPSNHYRIALLQADGLCELEKGIDRGDADDIFRAGLNDALEMTTTPSIAGYQGGVIADPGHTLSNISASGSTMTFDLDGGPSVDPGGCCPIVASTRFYWSSFLTADSNSNIAEVTFNLDREMDVQITADSSVRSLDSNVLMRSGVYDGSAANVMWTESYRRVQLSSSGAAQPFTTSMALRLGPGTHTIYWKAWVSGANVQFDSGALQVRGFEPSASPVVVGEASAGVAVEASVSPVSTEPFCAADGLRQSIELNSRGQSITTALIQ